MGRVKYYWYKDIRWASWALAEELNCDQSEIPARLAEIKKGPAVDLPTAEEAKEAAESLGAYSDTTEDKKFVREIVVTYADGRTEEFPSSKALAEELGVSPTAVTLALKRGTWKNRGIERVERVRA